MTVSAAMVLAAGMGTRMRPLTDTMPKPLVPLGGRALIDHVLDRLAAAGVGLAVVNVHYMAESIERHLAARQRPRIAISDERGELLDTGGGVRRALPLLGAGPFIIHNSDSVWIESRRPEITRLMDAWDGARMDALLMLARRDAALGYDGLGDFHMAADGRLTRRTGAEPAPHVFAGVSIASPRLFDGAPEGPFSLVRLWERAIAAGSVYGMEHDGLWMHVGTPQSLLDAEAALGRAQARAS